jgi:hypothetical protein
MLITCRQLESLSGVAHAFFTRDGGVSQGLYASLNGGLGSADAREAVLANRQRMAARLGVAHLVSVHQVHSPDVAVVEGPWPGDERPRADAMVTATPGVALGVLTADCGPVLFADPEARVVGAAHAGWKGTMGGVIEATVAAMERLGARRERIQATLGPTISRAAYEVGPEFVERLHGLEPDADRYLSPSARDGHAMFDLPAFIAMRLARAGVAAAHDLALCTYGDAQRFFSYRRATHRGEPDYGRLVSAIALT